MGDIRSFSRHVRWTEAEISVLKEKYPAAPLAEIFGLLPTRSARVIQGKANGLGLVRIKPPKRSPEETREAKRENMARRRLLDPDAARAYARADHQANREVRTASMREYIRRRFFWAKAMKLRGINRASPKQIAALWKAQRGRCALTGRHLDRSAQLDHKLPKARGGGDEITNLQWLCEAANLAKRDMTDAEFVALCDDIMSWIGQRIDLARFRLTSPSVAAE